MTEGQRKLLISALAAVLILPVMAISAAAAQPSGAEIVQRCDLDMNAGQDQRSRLTVILRDAAGNEKKNVYRRYWKNYGGKKNIVDKMILFTEFPPDARDTGFMRWGYMPTTGKNADQWVYLPTLKKIHRVSVRDPGDSFLGSDLTLQDISLRLVSQDAHKLLRTEDKAGKQYYVVESRPKEKNPLYQKVIAWYEKAPNWQDCNKRKIEYYGPRGGLLKTEKLSWQKVDGAWIWDEVDVKNLRTGHSSVFRITDVEVNVGLKNRLFAERTLKRGIR